MSSFRILSIDGGGIRGIYVAVLINRIVKEVPDLIDETIFFAGTSTGAILAMGLAIGIPPVETIELFRAYGKEVIKDSLMIKVGQVLGAKYDILNLRKILTPYFGAAILNDFLTNLNRFVLVPAFDLDGMVNGVRTWKPKFFHNFPGPDSDAGEMVVDVILRSSATPIYFPSYQGYIDGSVVARNPGMAALAQALNKGSGKQKIDDIRLLSFGTGYFPRYVGSREQNWGFGRWSWPLISLMLDGEMGVNNYNCLQILGPERYHRLAPLLRKPIGLDEVDALPHLIRFAEEVDIGPTVKWINAHYLDRDPPEGIGIKILNGEAVTTAGG